MSATAPPDVLASVSSNGGTAASSLIRAGSLTNSTSVPSMSRKYANPREGRLNMSQFPAYQMASAFLSLDPQFVAVSRPLLDELGRISPGT
jgi:hypothetical protein